MQAGWTKKTGRAAATYALCAVLLLLGGCAQSSGPDAFLGAGQGTPGSISDYHLGIQDRLRIVVYNEPQISGEYVVNDSGNISLALLGDISAAGLTLEGLQQRLQEQLSHGFLVEPRVSVEVTQYRPYYILGEVSQPGEYPYNGELTVIKAVAVAGGFTYRANKSTAFIKRTGSDGEAKYKISQDLRVYPGDIIRIGERFF
jgi:polysaccharide export outer membrane protein